MLELARGRTALLYFVEQVTDPVALSARVQDVEFEHRLAAHVHDSVCEPQGFGLQLALAVRVVVVV